MRSTLRPIARATAVLPSPSRWARRRMRSAWASSMLEEWLLTPIPSELHRSTVSLFSSPSSRASSYTLIFPAKSLRFALRYVSGDVLRDRSSSRVLLVVTNGVGSAAHRAIVVGESFGGTLAMSLALARPERVVLLGICLILNIPMVALWVLAVATHLTAVWRMVHVWRVTSAEPSASD